MPYSSDWPESKKQIITWVSSDVEKLELTYCWRNVQWCNHFSTQLCDFLQYSLMTAILFLGVYSKKWNHVHTKACKQTFILSAIAQEYKNLKWPSINEWVNKTWYIHKTEYYSLIKRNRFLIHATVWIIFKTFMLDSTYKWYDVIFAFLCASLNMTVSRTIHVAANSIISFFFMAE